MDRTTVRIKVPRWVAWSVAAAAAVAPRWTAARLIDRLLRTRRSRTTLGPLKHHAARIALPDAGAVAWVVGEGPRVYLLHGWDGSAADFAPLATALAAGGYRAILVDGPGHGAAPGDRSNVVLLARSLAAAVERFGPASAVVAHSFGAAATSLAISDGLEPGRVIMLAPEPDPGAYIDSFGVIGGPSFRDRVRDEMRRRVGLAPSQVGLDATLGDLRPLVIHDLGDRLVPFAQVARVVPRILRTEGLGHRRLLANPAVLRAVLAYVRDGDERSCVHGFVAGACPTCALEQELFRPELRLADNGHIGPRPPFGRHLARESA